MHLGDYFDATRSEWEDVYRRDTVYASVYRQRLRAALAHVDALGPARRRALDIGCGPGFGATALARRGFAVHAVDASTGMVQRTLGRARAERVATRVRGCVGDVRALAFDDGRFDLVMMVGVSEWLPSLELPLAEVARVLAPGGHLVMTADNGWALSCLIDPLQHPLLVPFKRALGRALRRLLPARQPLRTYARSRRMLTRALAAAGLTVTTTATLGFGPFTFCGRRLLPERWGQLAARGLTRLARPARSPLRGAGWVHLLVARKIERASC